MKSKVYNPFTFLGVIISLFGITCINLVFKTFFGIQLNDGQMMARELLILALVAFLCFYIIPKEKLTLASIGLHDRHWGKSILWAIGLALVLLAALFACIELCKTFGFTFVNQKSWTKLSKLVVAFITLRAGIAEEVFCRGYLLERFATITGRKWIALALSVILFGLLHYAQGPAGMITSMVGGLILSLFYFWKKDLKANIVAHFLVDFIPNVLLN